MGLITRKQLKNLKVDQAERDRIGPRRRVIREPNVYVPKDGDTLADVTALARAEQKRMRRRLKCLATHGQLLSREQVLA